LLEACMLSSNGMVTERGDDDIRIVSAVGEPTTALAIFDARCDAMPSDDACDCVKHLLRIYAKHLHLLDYAELDTLTKLNNRKTFDENFDHFIEIAELAQRKEGDERRDENDEKMSRPCWIGVVDIDKFKRINDNFGHLFGDEVLLRVAELMRKSFRASDKLFRFGGEEFVVMLRHVSPEMAHMVLDRFRKTVEEHEFPQVGQVTCSMGYMEIQPNLTPAEILGKADQALYYCKENGRNQIQCYGTLVAQGLVESATAAPTDAALQADIDALFD
ncbi:MAG TPA: GGDEF domain-containing protein, partial [Rhodocyclaceae bacterium]|nr:GGDEF domain-containing protein [Rhodocyclaceae bacterium]